MRSILTAIVLLLIFSLSLYADTKLMLNETEKQYLGQHKTITYISDPSWLPYEGYDQEDKHIGIVTDIIKVLINDIDSEINIDFKYLKSASWKETLNIANLNNVDLLTSDPKDPALQKNFNHTTAYLSNPIVIIMTNNNQYVSDLNYLANKRIAVVESYGYVKELRDVYPQIDFLYVKSLDEGLIGVSSKKYDVLLASAAATTYNISKLGLNNLSIVGSTEVDMKISFFVNKDNMILFNIINKAIKNLKNEDINKIMIKWSVVKFIQKVDYKLIAKIVSISLGLIILALIWSYNLKKSKNTIDKLNKELREKIDELEVLSITDAMTGLYNRRYFDKIFAHELNRAKRKKHQLIFAMFDVDHFKQYNDTYGHDNGDKALIQIARLMHDFTQRADEFAFRIGGEEFCIITSEMDEDSAFEYINRLRIAIQDSKIEHSGNSASKYITASFGLVIIDFKKEHTLTTKDIYKIADNTLYKAKEASRNNVQIVSIYS